ncbi:MAG: hypothetical protein R3310_12650 [Candidatus Competibacteraceae bacterium]|nr:hypothetical protein [Candidatus Competibacteraceae bacterium]
MVKDLDKDLQDLLAAARNAMNVLRRDAERFETIGLDAQDEREAVRRLNMAIQLVEYDLYDPGER